MMAILLGPLGRYLGGAAALLVGFLWLRHHFVGIGEGHIQPQLDAAKQNITALTGQVQAKERELAILNEVNVKRENELQNINQIAADIRSLSAGVSLLNRQTTFAVPPIPGATGEPAGQDASGQLRDATKVLQELGAYFAERADTCGIDYNTLTEWLSRTRTSP